MTNTLFYFIIFNTNILPALEQELCLLSSRDFFWAFQAMQRPNFWEELYDKDLNFYLYCICIFLNGACIVFIFPSPAHGRNLRLREHQSSLSVPLCLLLVWNRSVCTFVPSSGSFVAPQQATTALLLLVAYNITPAAVPDQKELEIFAKKIQNSSGPPQCHPSLGKHQTSIGRQI